MVAFRLRSGDNCCSTHVDRSFSRLYCSRVLPLSGFFLAVMKLLSNSLLFVILTCSFFHYNLFLTKIFLKLRHRKEIRNGRIVKIPMKGPQEKLEHTLESVGWPMIQAGASTIMCVLPLVFLQVNL